MTTKRSEICAYLLLASYLGITVYSYSMSLLANDNEISSRKDMIIASSLWHNSHSFTDTDSFLINTPGCYIPNYMKTFKYNYTGKANHKENPCGTRAVFVEVGANNKIYFKIDERLMEKYTIRNKYRCCFKFAYKRVTKSARNESLTDFVFTKCRPFKTGTTAPLIHEIIVVSCFPPRQKQIELYNDAYIKIKNLNVENAANSTKKTWNVVLMGLHAMSRARIFDTMPRTTRYLKKHKWLDYRGYQKVGSSTFPNLMSLLTGKNYTSIKAYCNRSLQRCAEYLIWNEFMLADYVTAYGEDYLKLPDTFSKYGGFRIRPTHHYMRPFYQLGERRVGNTMCLRRQPSASHLLDYGHQFTHTYKNNRFFGMFWINSYSHNDTDNPTMLDNEMADWFLKLNVTGVLENTFVIFFSDHGTKFGDMKLPIESYYEERLPMLFMWVPNEFRRLYNQKYTNLLVNQHRLITPFDVYMTLADILKITNPSNKLIYSEACPRCTSLFKLKPIRWTCVDGQVSENGCSCRSFTTVDTESRGTHSSVALAVEFIRNVTETVNTAPCMICKPLSLKTIFRSHTFEVEDRIYNVVAFELSSEVRFEATIVYRNHKSRVLYLHTISEHNKKGECVLDPTDSPYCDCDQTECK